MFLLKFLLFVFICGIAVILFIVLGILGVFRKARAQFRQEYNNASRQQAQQPHYEDQEVVIDPRNADERSRKIISEDEGEYVDFV
ncbi:MAG: DUF4834 family protein [Prevotella sp.]|nr:DUF4834 family protein [Prevotella sp.]MBQ6033492.1 DUF4834 family protein [Prevotella sp.]MBQ6658929.1 DUF4834 family protein [Prevotella sp.]MBQ9571503.1 DUF4834 family protein [Prevotella sp.]